MLFNHFTQQLDLGISRCETMLNMTTLEFLEVSFIHLEIGIFAILTHDSTENCRGPLEDHPFRRQAFHALLP